jgi:hypothetical protein
MIYNKSMTDEEKKSILKQIKKEWTENSPLSHGSFTDEHNETLQYLYINGYLTKNFYNKRESPEPVPSPKILFPLSEKGEKFISSSVRNVIKENRATLLTILLISIVGIVTWFLADNIL